MTAKDFSRLEQGFVDGFRTKSRDAYFPRLFIVGVTFFELTPAQPQRSEQPFQGTHGISLR